MLVQVCLSHRLEMISQMFFFFVFTRVLNHDGQTHPDLQHQNYQPCIPFILLALSESLCFDLIVKKITERVRRCCLFYSANCYC